MNGSRLAELRDTLLALYECARALEAPEVAYHALYGACHAAEQLHDLDTLGLIREHARREATGEFGEIAARCESAQQKGRPKAPFQDATS